MKQPRSIVSFFRSIKLQMIVHPLSFGRDYPKRSSFFLCKFIKHMVRSGVIYQVGTDAIALLALVVGAEDSIRYRRPPWFWRNQLMDLLGFDKNRLQRVRNRLQEIGWLYYEKGAKGRPSIMWVTIPGGDEAIDDAPIGATENDDQILGDRPNAPGQAETFGHSGVPGSRPNSCPNPVRIRDTFIPTPTPEPTPPPPTPSSPVRRTEEEEVSNQDQDIRSDPVLGPLVALAESAGIGKSLETILEAVRLQAPEAVRAVLEYATSFPVYPGICPETGKPVAVRRWGGGAVRLRLTHVDFARKGPQEGWAPADRQWKELHKRAAETSRREKTATAAKASSDAGRERLEQLQFKFGEALDRLSNDDLIALLTWGKEGTSPAPFYVKQIRQGGAKSPSVRPMLLQAFAARARAN